MPSSPRTDRVVLTGPPGSGKTALGPALAAVLGWDHVDLDAVITARAGCSVAAIFAHEGESGFRLREREALDGALAARRVVISAGGGALLRRDVRHRVLRESFVVSLTAPVDVLRARVAAQGGRPLLAHPDALDALLEARAALYREAHRVVDTRDEGPGPLARRIAPWVDGVRDCVVPLGARTYPVRFGALELLDAHSDPSSRRVVTDRRVRALPWFARRGGLSRVLVTLAPGERAKTLRGAERVWRALRDDGADRGAVLVGVGGGVVTDLTGFAASAWMRGVGFVTAPTTLLAMVDAAVGGKTGVDFGGGKNLVGAFHHPSAVVVDVETLETLPARALRAGMAEVVKVAAVCDASLLARVERSLPALAPLCAGAPGAWEAPGARVAVRDLVRAAVQAKVDVVADDEREQGARMLLNFGHTLGHAIESASGFRLMHGECVSLGMRGALAMGERAGHTPPELRRRVVSLLDALSLPARSAVAPNAVRAALPLDKKRAGAAMRWVVATGEGRGAVVSLDAAAVRAGMKTVLETR